MIPYKADEKNKPAFFARTLYKARSRIEQGFGRLKTIQAHRATLREDRHKFPIYRQFRRWSLLDQFVFTD